MNQCDKYLIQFMLQKGCAKSEQAVQFCRKISNGVIETHENLKDLISDINKQIKKQHFKIAVLICEVTQDSTIVWLNTKQDDISKLQSTFSALELEYFNAILKEIINSDYRKLKLTICLNISTTLSDTFPLETGQKALATWIKGGYFVKNGEFLYLGPRTILEFSAYLIKTNRDHNCICMLCSEIVFTGKICASCNKISHIYCLNRYQRNHKTCPNCNNVWRETEVFNYDGSSVMDVEDQSQDFSNNEGISTFRKHTQAGPSTAYSDESGEE